MTKSATIQARVEPGLKARVDGILRELGLSPSEAIMMFYSQIALNDGLPFEVKIPNKRTQRAMEDIRLRRNLTSAKDADELMRQLSVND